MALRAAKLKTAGNETPACSLLVSMDLLPRVSMEPEASGNHRRPVR